VSTSRISLPMYCIWRRSAPNLFDVLHLADRIAQVLGKVELRELVLAEFGQFLAEVAQLVHLLLDLGLARRQLFLVFVCHGLAAQAAPAGG